MKKGFIHLLGLVVFSALISACGNSSNEQTTPAPKNTGATSETTKPPSGNADPSGITITHGQPTPIGD